MIGGACLRAGAAVVRGEDHGGLGVRGYTRRMPIVNTVLYGPRRLAGPLRLAPLAFLLALASTSVVSGQRFLTVTPLGDDPTAGDWAVEADHDLLRSAPQRLEFELPDGRVLRPEMRVFEDRGDGNGMWAGGYPELGYDSVLLTLQDGQLIGRLGLPDGSAWWLRPGSGTPGPAGLLSEGGEASARACGGGIVPAREPVVPVAAAQRPDPPERASSASNHDRLDILMLYTPAAATRMGQAGWGEIGAAMQAAMDYLNLVLRNNQITVTAHMVHHQEAPAAFSGVVEPLGLLRQHRDVLDLRIEHQADLVHLFFAETPGWCGLAYLMARGHTPANFWPSGYGVTTVGGGCVGIASQIRDGEYGGQFETFAHEVGHNLGANHDPDNAGIDPEDAVEPYAFGHHNFEPTPNVKSVMSYNEGRQLPFFSNVRVQPEGYILGVANERENERALQRTIHLGVRFSDHLPEAGSPPPPPPSGRPDNPTDLKVMPTGSTSVKVTWTDRSGNEDGFEVHARLQGSAWATVARVPANTASADVDGLQAGGRYDFRVRAFNRHGGRNSSVATLVLPAPDYTDCTPAAAQVTFEHGFTVSMCVEYQRNGETVKEDARNYGLESRESALLYFFDRDNAEVLVKVLDACAVNGHRWVFVAPVTDLAFNLHVRETAANGDPWVHRNPRGGQTASTKSDVTAFPCPDTSAAAVSARGGAGSEGVELVASGSFPAGAALAGPPAAAAAEAPVRVAQGIARGEATECEPTSVATLAGGYTVKMCAEYLKDGASEVQEAHNFNLDSRQSGLLYFFERSNAEVLIKVLDACAVNGRRWVFVAPVTDLAFNLSVVSPHPDDAVWTHSNRLGQTAAPKSDTAAFACRN